MYVCMYVCIVSRIYCYVYIHLYIYIYYIYIHAYIHIDTDTYILYIEGSNYYPPYPRIPSPGVGFQFPQPMNYPGNQVSNVSSPARLSCLRSYDLYCQPFRGHSHHQLRSPSSHHRMTMYPSEV